MVCEKEQCTGCFACYNACPCKAIDMVKDEYGNIYPRINQEKCVKCGLCQNVCPQLNEDIVFYQPKKVYAMYSNDETKRAQSTSGGAATLFCESIIEEGGIVYGAANLLGENDFSFKRITKREDLIKIKGSKYVHCYVNDTFSKVKEDLKKNKKVIFIGTPCQIAGLKKYVAYDDNNLITVDLICHGVPSQKLLFDEFVMRGIAKNDVQYLSFRDDKMYNFKITDKMDKVIFEQQHDRVDYYKNFLQGNIFRENCYSCKYARSERIADITIGDFWGLSKDCDIYDDEKKGISLVLANTTKGIDMINNVKNKSCISERTLGEAIKVNKQLNHPAEKTLKYEKYKEYYPKIGYKRTLNKMYTLKEKIARFINNNKILNAAYKRIKL